MSDKPLLSVKTLSVDLPLEGGTLHAVRRVSFDLKRGETLALVGESGCGKSMAASALMRLLPEDARTPTGRIDFDGTELLSLMESEMRAFRGARIALIFQEPATSFNPVMTVGAQIVEMIRAHRKMTSSEARATAIEWLRRAGVPEPERRFDAFPHELSGGLKQRAMIAMALSAEPDIVIADEPTTALDVTIQAQILDLLRNLKDQINSSIMFITHDLGVIAEMADYVVVMYAGRIVEQGTAEEIFSHPAHPYTIGLMASKPVVGRQVDKLYSIPGKVPNPINMPNYCYFKDRCEMCVNGCEGDYPCEVSISPTHKVSCYRYYDGKRPDLEEVVEEELAEGKENGKEGE